MDHVFTFKRGQVTLDEVDVDGVPVGVVLRIGPAKRKGRAQWRAVRPNGFTVQEVYPSREKAAEALLKLAPRHSCGRCLKEEAKA